MAWRAANVDICYNKKLLTWDLETESLATVRALSTLCDHCPMCPAHTQASCFPFPLSSSSSSSHRVERVRNKQRWEPIRALLWLLRRHESRQTDRQAGSAPKQHTTFKWDYHCCTGNTQAHIHTRGHKLATSLNSDICRWWWQHLVVVFVHSAHTDTGRWPHNGWLSDLWLTVMGVLGNDSPSLFLLLSQDADPCTVCLRAAAIVLARVHDYVAKARIVPLIHKFFYCISGCRKKGEVSGLS